MAAILTFVCDDCGAKATEGEVKKEGSGWIFGTVLNSPNSPEYNDVRNRDLDLCPKCVPRFFEAISYLKQQKD